VISQGSFVTTGSHRYATDMALVTRPVTIADGVWVTARCVLLSGTRIGTSALVLPGTVVRGEVPAGMLYGGCPPHVVGERFLPASSAKVFGSEFSR
jgi:putative colanic acid biosynthesis acetyltransferase WcaF